MQTEPISKITNKKKDKALDSNKYYFLRQNFDQLNSVR